MALKFCLIISMVLLLSGFSLTPMSHTIDLTGKQKQAQFLLNNPTAEPMAVEVSVRERIQKEDGTEETPEATELAAFPPQLVIPPNEKRSVRVQWVGKTPNRERSFRVIAEQLPLQVDGKKQRGSGIKMLLKYVAALYVDPGNTSPDLHITQVVADNTLSVTIENRGTRHQLLTNPVLTLSKGSKRIKLKSDQLKGLAGENILAGAKRVFNLPAQSDVATGFSGTIKVD